MLEVTKTLQGEEKVLRQRQCRNGHRFITAETVTVWDEFREVERQRLLILKSKRSEQHKPHA